MGFTRGVGGWGKEPITHLAFFLDSSTRSMLQPGTSPEGLPEDRPRAPEYTVNGVSRETLADQDMSLARARLAGCPGVYLHLLVGCSAARHLYRNEYTVDGGRDSLTFRERPQFVTRTILFARESFERACCT